MEDNKQDIEQVEHTHIIINCDGYYPECGNCGYWFKRSEIDCEICPECEMKINWEDRR
jgi:predicted Zn-ribbon and HTH transcriptional regulator